ncbi:hypothetical protein BLOT_010231 [Blomia tropicalis]|nr:hypothetical protein BLOT_010231 [Blomia tropicalis]
MAKRTMETGKKGIASFGCHIKVYIREPSRTSFVEFSVIMSFVCSRRKFIELLGLELIKPLIIRRIQSGLGGLQTEIRNNIKLT